MLRFAQARERGNEWPDVPSELAHCCAWKELAVLALHNLGDVACDLVIDPAAVRGDRLVELLSDAADPVDLPLGRPLRRDASGYRWFRVRRGRA